MRDMRCVVETDFDAWDFGTVKEARAWFKTLVDYAESGRTDQGEGAEFVYIWKESESKRAAGKFSLHGAIRRR